MKEIININYKAIFKYQAHKETILYNEKGTYVEENNKKSIIFDTKEQHLEIHLLEKTIFLQNNHTKLRLEKDKKIRNTYQSEYGTMELITKLVTFENKETIKIKYQLFDQEELLSEVYILITIKKMEN